MLESAQVEREEEKNYQGDLESFTAFILVRISQEHSVPSSIEFKIKGKKKIFVNL